MANIYIGKTESNMQGFRVKQGSLNVGKNKIWSENTGRVSNGDMTGDLVATKYKLEATLNAMGQAESAALDDIISEDFFYAKFINPASSSGGWKTIKVYGGDVTYPVYSYATGNLRYVGTGISLIEK